MDRNHPLDHRIVILIGEALQPLLRKVDARLSEPARPMDTMDTGVTEKDTEEGFLDAAKGFLDAAESFVDVAQRALGRYGDSMERLCKEANDVIGRIAGTGDVSAEVHRAVGRFEMVLDELMDTYVEMREARPGRDHERGRDLLSAALRHTLEQVQGWLQDVVDTAADPLEVMKRKGLPTDGSAKLELMLTLTTPTALEELDDWVSEQEREVEELERSLEARRAGGGPGCAAGLAALVAGIFLGGWFFGGDDE